MKDARIAVNARWMQHPPGGVRRYAAEISSRLGAEARSIIPRGRLKGVYGHLWEQLILPGRTGSMTLWSPANTGPLRVANQVLSIHDLGPIDHPEWYHPLFAVWYAWLWPRLAGRVREILAPSEFTLQRIVDGLQIDREKVRLVFGGVDHKHFHPQSAEAVDRVRSAYGIPEEYVLFVGDLQPRKNLAGLLEAWRMFQRDTPGMSLVLAGSSGRPFRRARLDLDAQVYRIGRVPEQDLPALYGGASLFVQPSFYEGGGLTVLEALGCGCPVLAAGNTGMAEYLGDAGWTFDPYESGALSAALTDLLGRVRDLGDTREAGIARARSFTWDEAAAGVRQSNE